MEPINFELNTQVTLIMSNEKGVVIGIAEYSEMPKQYFVRYLAADGRQCEAWFSGNALTIQ